MRDWAVHTTIDIKGYKKILDKIIKNKTPAPVKDRSTRGSDSKQYLIYEYKDRFLEIQESVKKEITRHTGQNNLSLLAAWTVLGYENSYHTVHNHNDPTNHIATVLYLKVPKPTINKGGQFYFFNGDEKGNIRYHEIKPQEGSLIIMPIHTFHGCYPQAKGLRQTLNMDFEVAN